MPSITPGVCTQHLAVTILKTSSVEQFTKKFRGDGCHVPVVRSRLLCPFALFKTGLSEFLVSVMWLVLFAFLNLLVGAFGGAHLAVTFSFMFVRKVLH